MALTESQKKEIEERVLKNNRPQFAGMNSVFDDRDFLKEMEEERKRERLRNQKFRDELKLAEQRSPSAMAKIIRDRALQQGGRRAVYGDVSKRDIVRNLRKPEESPAKIEIPNKLTSEQRDKEILERAKEKWAREDEKWASRDRAQNKFDALVDKEVGIAEIEKLQRDTNKQVGEQNTIESRTTDNMGAFDDRSSDQIKEGLLSDIATRQSRRSNNFGDFDYRSSEDVIRGLLKNKGMKEISELQRRTDKQVQEQEIEDIKR